MIRPTLAIRLAAAAWLFVALAALSLLLPALFVPVVLAAMVMALVVCWMAWWRIRPKLLQALLSGERIESLRTAYNALLFGAIGASVTASLALFVAARALGVVDAVPREAFLVVLSYPPLLAMYPAIDWLLTVGRLEREE